MQALVSVEGDVALSDLLFVVALSQDHPHQGRHRCLVGEGVNHIGASLDRTCDGLVRSTCPFASPP